MRGWIAAKNLLTIMLEGRMVPEDPGERLEPNPDARYI